MLVKCIREPRGDKGLEGFELGELYQLRPLPGKTKEYAVVLPDGVTCCMPQSVFNKHFRQIPL